MHRRGVLAIGVTVLAAGCSDLGLGGSSLLVDESFSDSRQFSASEGDRVEVSIAAEEVDDAEADQGSSDVAQRSVSVSISYDGQPFFAESVEDEATFEEELPGDGEYNVVVSSGTANVRIERV